MQAKQVHMFWAWPFPRQAVGLFWTMFMHSLTKETRYDIFLCSIAVLCNTGKVQEPTVLAADLVCLGEAVLVF